MNDIKNEIEFIKSEILAVGNVDLSNYHLATNEQLHAIARIETNGIKWLSSLITTIESQKEEIAEAQRSARYWQGCFDGASSQIESLKAITELAVKGLKEIACLNVDSAYSAGTIARNTFSEIEKLKNE